MSYPGWPISAASSNWNRGTRLRATAGNYLCAGEQWNLGSYFERRMLAEQCPAQNPPTSLKIGRPNSFNTGTRWQAEKLEHLQMRNVWRSRYCRIAPMQPPVHHKSLAPTILPNCKVNRCAPATNAQSLSYLQLKRWRDSASRCIRWKRDNAMWFGDCLSTS